MTTFNKDTVKSVMFDLNAAIEAISEKYDLKGKMGTVRWDAALAKMSVEFAAEGENGEDLNALREWDAYCYSYDLKPEDFGKVFTAAGKQFKVSGIKPRASKMPILATEVATGKRYKFSALSVRHGLTLTGK